MGCKKSTYDILVTGGAGFIGSHLVHQLLTQHENVIILDDLSGGFIENISPETHFIRRFNYTNNVTGSVNLINAAINHEVRCFVFTSSIAVYGQNQLPMSEDMLPVPEDPYGVAKDAVEMELRAARRQSGLNYIIFRPHNVYGEYQNIGYKYRNVVGIFMNQIIQDKPLTIFGDGEQVRAFTYIKDIIPVISNSIYEEGCYNDVYNIGAERTHTINQVASEVMAALNKKVDIRNLAERNEVKYAYSSHDKMKHTFHKYLGRETALQEGVENMARWVEEAGPRKSPEFKHIEVTRNLPDSWIS